MEKKILKSLEIQTVYKIKLKGKQGMKTLKLVIAMLITLLVSAYSSNAQVTQMWATESTYPGYCCAIGHSVAVDNNGMVYSVGIVWDRAAYLVKYNSAGSILWERKYENGPDSRGYCVAVDNAGNVIMSGTTYSNPTGMNALVIKFNSNGDSLWTRIFHRGFEDYTPKLKLDDSGNVYVAGHSQVTPGTGFDNIVIKYNSSGVLQWSQTYNSSGTANDFVLGFDVDKNGNSYTTGRTGLNVVTIKYNSGGTLEWINNYIGLPGIGSEGSFVKADNSGNVFVCGVHGTPGTGGDYLTMKLNATTGDSLWIRSYNGPCNGYLSDFATSLAVDGSGNVFVTGASTSCSGRNYDFATVKYNPNGVEQWVSRYDGAGANNGDYGKAIEVDEMGSIYVAGLSCESSFENFATIKYDKDGNQNWLQIYGSPTAAYTLNGMKIDNSGNVYVVGKSPDASSTSKLATVKYSQSGLRLTALIEGLYNSVTDKMVRDSVTVLLRNTTPPFGISDSAKTTLDSAGKGIFIFNNSSPGSQYYIVVKHRNSVETWSSGGILITNGIADYDFTTSSSQAFGNNLVLKGSRHCVFSGDCDQDKVIDGADLSFMDNSVLSSLTGYVTSDINGDLVTDGSDFLIVDNNAFKMIVSRNPMDEPPLSGRSTQMIETKTAKDVNESFRLEDNFPNPFNPSTTIKFTIPNSSIVKLSVYDISGREVAVLVNEQLNSGTHSINFDASHLSSGMYFYKITANGFQQVKKMMLVK
ncbi:MAG: hypothetical protein HGGPFJEG_02897 [Ignavibacteria bacterium]|nr:hypothetical protein [Ignavibacteria bacterium]